ncbi:MAG: type I secretion system permease/ATPase [Chlorobiaceae bacterium]|nr:type I secretion system permease/ATPase [Chlorobiaceae bacterium]
MKKPRFSERSDLTRHLWAFRKEFAWVGIFSFIANLLMLTPTLYMLQIYDRVFKSRSELTLLFITLIVVFFYAVMAIAEWLRSRLLVRGGVRMDEALNSIVFNASFERHLKEAGRNPAEAFTDLTTIRQFLTGNGIFAFFDLPWTPIYIAVVFLLNPFIGWLSILFVCIQLGMTLWNSRSTSGDIEQASEAAAKGSGYVMGKLRNIEPVHAMGMLPSLRSRWQELYADALDKGARASHKQHKNQAVSKLVRYSMQSLTLGAGALMVLDGRMAAAGMIAANVLMSRALQPIDLVMSAWKPFIQAREAFRRTEALLSEFPGRPAGEACAELLGQVSLESLAARAPGRQAPILQGIGLDVPAGTVVGIVGPSGSGKTTLARCIVGAWPDVEGRVLIDDINVGLYDRPALGHRIGYLPQDIELFDGTIAENIARFSQVDPAKIIEATRRTGIHDMILRFPNGYNTQVGEAGGMLSGGQRQRIGLARALYGNPALVVLDEPNSNLDDAGDRALVQAVTELKQSGRTVFLITHRPNILAVVDRLIVMKDGRVEHYGPREGVLEVLRARAAQASGPVAPSANRV